MELDPFHIVQTESKRFWIGTLVWLSIDHFEFDDMDELVGIFLADKN